MNVHDRIFFSARATTPDLVLCTAPNVCVTFARQVHILTNMLSYRMSFLQLGLDYVGVHVFVPVFFVMLCTWRAKETHVGAVHAFTRYRSWTIIQQNLALRQLTWRYVGSMMSDISASNHLKHATYLHRSSSFFRFRHSRIPIRHFLWLTWHQNMHLLTSVWREVTDCATPLYQHAWDDDVEKCFTLFQVSSVRQVLFRADNATMVT